MGNKRKENEMRRVLFFMLTSLNGFYEQGRWEIDWHNVDDEFTRFAIEQLESVDTLLFGRATYEGMASYWPTPAAVADSPATAEQMNSLPKIVFSKTLHKAEWNNTRLVRGDAAEEIKKLKEQPGKDMIILASSDLAASLAEHGLIDEYRIMVNPIALGEGKPLFQGMKRDLRLKLLDVRRFASGNVLLSYAPA